MVFIGNLGVGKSSVVEALETVQIACTGGPGRADRAMQRWNGIEHASNKSASRPGGNPKPISIELAGVLSPTNPHEGHKHKDAKAAFSVEFSVDGDISELNYSRRATLPKAKRDLYVPDIRVRELMPSLQEEQIVASLEQEFEHAWQFLFANPDQMGRPQPAQSLASPKLLQRDASNIAAYIRRIYERDRNCYETLICAMRQVVPYATTFSHEQTGELIRQDYITLTESDFKVPGWLISTGTLRVLAILACLHNPDPPRLLVIEELENGLDPRTLGLVLSEIQDAVESGRTQVIVTTHSPYLLDQVPLEYVVTVESQDGSPVFNRPAGDAALVKWREDFSNGRLFTVGKLWGGSKVECVRGWGSVGCGSGFQ